ncbi:unnamed protein product [Soboliphyme baturini]|uniref:WHEP-TRS domain-containing protein n=1 Tax=Soboliphyme baturini TaxID=241478 RepID=A0A3P7XZG3_9BILA|nr:unnamed protein product [Soboliphyme baturini]
MQYYSYAHFSSHTGTPQPCILFFVPDGHKKELPTALKRKEIKSKASISPSVSSAATEKIVNAEDLLQKIKEVGDEIRALKNSKASKAHESMASTDIAVILTEIKAQGDKVRELKSKNIGKVYLLSSGYCKF